jgi:hypothetical protein
MVRALPGLLAVEVELQRKSNSRMAGIALMYERWIREREIVGVLYVCANDRIADHVHEHGTRAGLRHGRGLWTELLDDIREQARTSPGSPPGAQVVPAAADG